MRVFPPVEYSFCLWATFPLLVAFLSIWLCSQSLVVTLCSYVAHASSVHRKFCVLVTVTCSVYDYPIAGPLPSFVIFPPLSLVQSLCLVSLNPPPCRRACLCVGCVQTSCGLGWISSPARLLLEIHPGFSSQSKSGRPRLSQHTTGPSMSTHSSSSSAAQREGERERESLVYTSY